MTEEEEPKIRVKAASGRESYRADTLDLWKKLAEREGREDTLNSWEKAKVKARAHAPDLGSAEEHTGDTHISKEHDKALKDPSHPIHARREMQAKKSREAWEPRRRMGQVPDKFAAWYIGIPAIVIGIPLIALVLLVPVSSHITGLTMGFWLLGALINIVWGLADLYFRKAFLAPINSNLQKVGYHLDLNTMKMAPGDAPKASAAGYYIGLIGLSLLLSWLLLVVNIIIKIAGKLSTLQEAEHVVAYRAALSMPNLLRADIVRIHLLFMEKNLQRKLSEKEMNELFVHSSLPDEEIIQVMRDLER